MWRSSRSLISPPSRYPMGSLEGCPHGCRRGRRCDCSQCLEGVSRHALAGMLETIIVLIARGAGYPGGLLSPVSLVSPVSMYAVISSFRAFDNGVHGPNTCALEALLRMLSLAIFHVFGLDRKAGERRMHGQFQSATIIGAGVEYNLPIICTAVTLEVHPIMSLGDVLRTANLYPTEAGGNSNIYVAGHFRSSLISNLFWVTLEAVASPRS